MAGSSFAVNNQCYVIAALAKAISAALWSRVHPLQRAATIYEDGLYDKVGSSHILTFVLHAPVGDSRKQELLQRQLKDAWC